MCYAAPPIAAWTNEDRSPHPCPPAGPQRDAVLLPAVLTLCYAACWSCCAVQDRNETLFYRLLCENFVEMAPIIYSECRSSGCVDQLLF